MRRYLFFYYLAYKYGYHTAQLSYNTKIVNNVEVLLKAIKREVN